MDISETNLNSNENMFNKKSKLNELLEKDNKCKLEEVLDQEELITELKYQKNYLFNYFNKNQLKNVLNYVLIEPLLDDQKIAHVYPWKCTEIICSDANFITEQFFTFEYEDKEIEGNNNNDIIIDKPKEKKRQRSDSDSGSNSSDISIEIDKGVEKIKKNIELLDYMFNFLDTDKELNYVLVGYFVKILNFLFYRNNDILLNYFFEFRPDVIDLILKWSKHRVIDLIPKILTINTDKEHTLENAKTLEKRTDIIKALFLKLSSQDFEEVDNVFYVLTEIMQEKYNIEILMKIKLDVVNVLLKNIDNKAIYDFYFDKTIQIIILILKSNPENNNNNDENSLETEEKIKLDLSNTNENDREVVIKHKESTEEVSIKCLEQKYLFEDRLLSEYSNIMSHFDMKNDINKDKVPILGSKRICIVELIYNSLSTSHYLREHLPILIINSGFFKLLLDYYFTYEWNNIYQSSCNILLIYLTENYELNYSLTNFIINDFNLLEQIRIYYDKTPKYKFTLTSNSINQGYLSSLVILAKNLKNLRTVDNFSSKFNGDWEYFYEEYIESHALQYEKKLCDEIKKPAPKKYRRTLTNEDYLKNFEDNDDEDKKEEDKKENNNNNNNNKNMEISIETYGKENKEDQLSLSGSFESKYLKAAMDFQNQNDKPYIDNNYWDKLKLTLDNSELSKILDEID